MANPFQIKQDAKRFQQCHSVEELAILLHTNPARISLACLQPQYHIYHIRKANGKLRLIEDPVRPAKKMLSLLNDYLQACYHALRPQCVHGFCISSSAEDERNMVTNARRHLGKSWMLNIDFLDFFHTVHEDKVQQVWKLHFRKFNKHLTETLTRLTCFRGRLPMGSPTSPVLSNYATLKMDEELMQLCAWSGITYTRFADDCSFSSDCEIDRKTIQMIRDVITAHRFIINEDKQVLYRPEDEKIVTGIVVGQSVLSLPEGYLSQIRNEIERLKHVNLVEQRYCTGMSLKKLKLFEQELRGKINYTQMVLGHSPETEALYTAFEEALQPDSEFESTDWLDLPYNFF